MTWVIAHRGASHAERENTIPAFERALAIGVDFVELDVQASSDGVLVVFFTTRRSIASHRFEGHSADALPQSSASMGSRP